MDTIKWETVAIEAHTDAVTEVAVQYMQLPSIVVYVVLALLIASWIVNAIQRFK